MGIQNNDPFAMKLTILIQDEIDDNYLTLPRFIQAARQQHQINLVFFQFDAVNILKANNSSTTLHQAWRTLATQGIPLVACLGSLTHRNIAPQSLPLGFSAGSYGVLSEQIDSADRILTFGSGA